MRKRRLALVGGKSGGHLTPLLQIARQWDEKERGDTFVFTTSSKLDTTIVQAFPFLQFIFSVPFDRMPSSWKQYPVAAVQALYSFVKSFIILGWLRPAMVDRFPLPSISNLSFTETASRSPKDPYSVSLARTG